MTIDPNAFTNKTSEALSAAKDLAQEFGHSSIHPLHMLTALFQCKDQLLPSILKKAAVEDPTQLERKAKSAMVKLPSVSPPPTDVSLHAKAIAVLQTADKLRQSQKVKQLLVIG